MPAFYFLDIFLIGGSWGLDIYQDLIEASHAGVKLLFTITNVFSVGNEITELWEKFRQKASSTPNLVALDANIKFEGPSAIPFGVEKITRLFVVSQLQVP